MTNESSQSSSHAKGMVWQIPNTILEISEQILGRKYQPCLAVLTLPAGESSDQSFEGGIEEENRVNEVEENPSWETLLSKILSTPGRRSSPVRPK